MLKQANTDDNVTGQRQMLLYFHEGVLETSAATKGNVLAFANHRLFQPFVILPDALSHHGSAHSQKHLEIKYVHTSLLAPISFDGANAGESFSSLLSLLSATSIPEFTLSGTESANAFFGAFLAESQNGLANADSIGIALIGVLNSKQSGFRQAGNYAARGFAIGIREGRSSAISAAIELASSTLSAVKNRLNEHSPSKETAALGQYFSLGLAEGIDQYSYVAKQSADSMSQEALDAVKAELAALASVSLDDLDTSPVIRPVIDISDVSAGVGAISSMMQVQPGIQVRGIMSAATPDNLRAVAEENRSTDTSGIMREIQAINGKLDVFSAQLANMKVVLDSGELVGGIQSKVDAALGRNAKMRERS